MQYQKPCNEQQHSHYNSIKKESNKLKIISQTPCNSKDQQRQTIETLEDQLQQVVKQQEFNQKNNYEQYLDENFLTRRIDITTLNFKQELNQTITLTQIYSCTHCLGSLSQNQIYLPCFHQYHQECFIEKVNLFLAQEHHQFFQCICNTSIPYKTLINLTQNNKELVNELIIHQQAWLISAFLTKQNQIPRENINNIKKQIRKEIQNYKDSLIKK